MNISLSENILGNKKFIVLGCFILVTAAHCFLPASFEAYEKYFSILISGTYTDFAILDYDTDIQFLLFSIYAGINKIFPNIQVYGYAMFIYNIVSLTLFGYILYDIIKKKVPPFILLITFPIIFLAISSYQIVNLSSTRIVFISCASLFYLIYNNRLKFKNSNLVLILAFLFISLIRIDATLLAAMIFFLITIFLKKIKIEHLIPLYVSFSVFVSYNILINVAQREDKQVYYYRELDLFDRRNIDFSQLSERDSLYVSMLTDYSIMDVNHFKIDYVNNLLETKSSNFLNSILNPKLFLNTLENSVPDIYYARWLILLCFILIIWTILSLKPRRKYILLLFILFILPYFLCLYITLPLRFTEPYYILFSLLLASLLQKKAYYLTFLVIVIASLNNVKVYEERYKAAEKNFKINYKYLVSNSEENKPIVIEGIDTGNFFSPDPLFNLRNTHAVFLNFVFFNSYECYKSSWKKICNCNALSLIDKLEYISRNNARFITTDEIAEVYKKYVKLYWGRNINFEKREQVNGTLNAYKVIF